MNDHELLFIPGMIPGIGLVLINVVLGPLFSHAAYTNMVHWKPNGLRTYGRTWYKIKFCSPGLS